MQDPLARCGGTLVDCSHSSQPLIICFHGSGDSCSSWAPLVELLSGSYRILLWDRGNSALEDGVNALMDYLSQAQLPAPYVLLAHSFGGTFARWFLHLRSRDVAGMVLVETGQETPLSVEVEQQQLRNQILGHKPLVVIRGNTLIGKWAEYEEVLSAENHEPTPRLRTQKQFLEAMDKEDEALKKAQLSMSCRCRYIHIPDCGHNVVRERPQVVAEEVHWAMQYLFPSPENSSAERVDS